jgi:hypothetical protein
MWWKYLDYGHVYSGEMRPAETVPGMGEGE